MVSNFGGGGVVGLQLLGGCGLQFLGGVWSPIFRGGGVVSNFGGGVWSPIFFGGDGGVSKFWGVSKFFFQFFSSFFFPISFSPKFLLGCTNPPPPQTVNARAVRILLECILVWIFT